MPQVGSISGVYAAFAVLPLIQRQEDDKQVDSPLAWFMTLKWGGFAVADQRAQFSDSGMAA
ncbi:hypothetical protein OAE79_00390 [Rhodopirellula sp.]|nr:hypothetical protein [Rhodopirellula sp.]MDB4678768.1 hypothetical protein [Rhodopirellula sp.]